MIRRGERVPLELSQSSLSEDGTDALTTVLVTALESTPTDAQASASVTVSWSLAFLAQERIRGRHPAAEEGRPKIPLVQLPSILPT
jgi:hypothetical protein